MHDIYTQRAARGLKISTLEINSLKEIMYKGGTECVIVLRKGGSSSMRV